MVTVIIPMYNRESTIKMAVDSVLKQTFSDFEIIVIDDCSKDRSVEAVKELQDKRIRIITCQENGGACRARNIGLEHAKGDIIAFHDSDDYWHEEKLEKSLYYLEKTKADFVFSAVYRKGEPGAGEKAGIVPSYNLNEEENKLRKLLCRNCVSTQTIVAKREVFEEIRFDPRLPRFQDWDLALQVVKKGFQVYYIEEPLVDCYVMSDSITADEKKAVKAIKIFEEKYASDLEQDKEAYSGFYCWAACKLDRSGYDGTEYFQKAYQAKPGFLLGVRYILSKMRLYGVITKGIDKCLQWVK